MCAQMKVMIAYDGSDYAEAALNDIGRAGLRPSAEILVVSVVKSSAINQPISEFDLHSLMSRRASRIIERATVYKQKESQKVKKCVSRAADSLRLRFPEWQIRDEVLDGKPAASFLLKAAEWKPDLIVLGTQGHSAFKRFFLGSVSRKVAEIADCSVRIGRRGQEEDGSTLNKVIIGASSLPDAEEVIRAARQRTWAEDTQIRLVVADDGISAGRVSAVYPYAKAIFEQAVEELRATGTQVSIEIKSGNTEAILLDEAESWNADSIFVVNEKANEEKGLGNLAANLLARAKCTVEIVR